MPKVLIVEDDESMGVALQDGFQYEGYEVLMATDGATGLQLARDETPDLIILDVMLPRMSGLDVCKEIRGDGNAVPIIMLTARSQEIDKVLGLKLGADDYVTKPFSFLELTARVEAVLRRSAPPSTDLEGYRFGDVEVDFRRSELKRGGGNVDVSPRELQLLRCFIENRGEVLSREKLLETVWGYQDVHFTRTVDMHIAKLRKKIEDTPSDPRFIVTVHRMGYKFTG